MDEAFAGQELLKLVPMRRDNRRPFKAPRHTASSSPLVIGGRSKLLGAKLLGAELLGAELHRLGAERGFGLCTQGRPLGLVRSRPRRFFLAIIAGRGICKHGIQGVVEVVAPTAFIGLEGVVEPFVIVISYHIGQRTRAQI